MFTKIFKKPSPDGTLDLYLQKREFISENGKIEDLFGAAHVPNLQVLKNGDVL